jgi:trimethyllysine dioxygenase
MWTAVPFPQRRHKSCWNASLLSAPHTMVRSPSRSLSALIEELLGGFYDFTADLASKDTAYTSLALRAHTDTTYFSDPAGLQMFHLLSHTDGSGGESLLVDGFAAARILWQEAKQSFEALRRKKYRTHASGNEGISIQPSVFHPVLKHSGSKLYQVRWNADDRATMDRWTKDEDLEGWYEAAWKWSEILRRPSTEYWEQLRPGRPLSAFAQMSSATSGAADNLLLVFDNWRVLHGRSAFTGKRRICGGYSRFCYGSKLSQISAC